MSGTSVLVQRLPNGTAASLPLQATGGAAGFDLQAAEDAVIAPGAIRAVATGMAMAIPPGFEGQVRPRSGLALRHGVTVLNAPGTIDSDYRGEIKVILINHGSEPFSISAGDRIAQMVFARTQHVTFEQVETLPASARGTGGFGSTGTSSKSVG